MTMPDVLDQLIPYYLRGHGPLAIDQLSVAVGALVPGATDFDVRNSMQRLALEDQIAVLPDGRWRLA